jgi:hypothetical protein
MSSIRRFLVVLCLVAGVAAPRAVAAEPIRIFVFLHDDLFLPVSGHEFFTRYATNQPLAVTPAVLAQEIRLAYLAPWVADFTSQVAPGERVELHFRSRLRGITDIPYGYREVLLDWAVALQKHASRHALPVARSQRDKFLLLTPSAVAPGIAGIAHARRHAAMVSLGAGYVGIAHELGHLFAATHEDSEVRRTPWWWCQTNMHPYDAPWLTNCHGYSAANRERIRDYVHLYASALAPGGAERDIPD